MKIDKIAKVLTNLHDISECVIHMKNLKQALNHGLVLEKVHQVIKLYQNSCLKPYIYVNTDLRKKSKK